MSSATLIADAFGEGTSLYEILGVCRTATAAQLRKAYYRKALACHPDKVGPGREHEFQALSVAYEILQNAERRAEYDETGELVDDDDGDGVGFGFAAFRRKKDGGDGDDDDDATSFDAWKAYFDGIFGRVTTSDIDRFAEKYKCSEEEERDVLKYYEQFRGNLVKMLDSVMLSTERDTQRWVEDFIRPAISNGSVPDHTSSLERSLKKCLARIQKTTTTTTTTATTTTAKKKDARNGGNDQDDKNNHKKKKSRKRKSSSRKEEEQQQQQEEEVAVLEEEQEQEQEELEDDNHASAEHNDDDHDDKDDQEDDDDDDDDDATESEDSVSAPPKSSASASSRKGPQKKKKQTASKPKASVASAHAGRAGAKHNKKSKAEREAEEAEALMAKIRNKGTVARRKAGFDSLMSSIAGKYGGATPDEDDPLADDAEFERAQKNLVGQRKTKARKAKK